MTKEDDRKTVLVLPAAMPAALQFCRHNRQRYNIVGASSNYFETMASEYPVFEFLPHVSDSTFQSALLALLQQYRVGAIYCAHQVLWSYIDKLSLPAVELLNAPPIPALMSDSRASVQFAEYLLAQLGGAYSDCALHDYPSKLELSALHYRFMQTPGECDQDKLLLFVIAAASAPQGDVVEIGSLWGRSAYALAWLANYYQLGATLCVDPWEQQELVQSSEGSLLTRHSTGVHDIAEGFVLFCQNMLASGLSQVNYLRMRSDQAYTCYLEKAPVSSPEFGQTSMTGQIALLHVDGNHDFEVVARDLAEWAPLVCKGGWIVVDDYTWGFGDGPRRAADALLGALSVGVARSFCLGGALAIRLL